MFCFNFKRWTIAPRATFIFLTHVIMSKSHVRSNFKGWTSTFHGLSGRRSPLASFVPRSRGLGLLVPSPLSMARRKKAMEKKPRASATQANSFRAGGLSPPLPNLLPSNFSSLFFWIRSKWPQKSNWPHRTFRLLTRLPATQAKVPTSVWLIWIQIKTKYICKLWHINRVKHLFDKKTPNLRPDNCTITPAQVHLNKYK